MLKHIVDITVDEIMPPLDDEQINAARKIINIIEKANMDIHEAASILDFCKESILRTKVLAMLNIKVWDKDEGR